ncbi:MAG: heme A synthase [Acidobacteria bacterium]|nr:heme A synthase [Acidobacteriota bacterium]
MSETAAYNAWLHRYAMLTAFCTFLLVIAGGLVTSTGSGLAVPDWPLSYGTFFPPMVGGILYEHGHRMIAGTVGIMTMLLAVWMWRSEPRRWVRRLAASAVLAVLVQAGLGGLTVIFLLPTAVSVAHAGLAMGFFSITCALALVTSPSWLGSVEREHLEGSMPLPRLAAAATLALYAQILIGATVRHTGSGLACPDFPLCDGQVIPPIDSIGVALHLTHRLGAVAVTCMVIWVYRRVLGSHPTVPGLVVPATIALTLVGVQLLLGALTVWNALAVEPTTAHVGGGALLLITMLTLTLRAYRQYSSPAATVGAEREALA